MFRKIKARYFITGYLSAHIFDAKLKTKLYKVVLTKGGSATVVNIYTDFPELLIGKGGKNAIVLSAGLSKALKLKLKLNIVAWNKQEKHIF
jgi:ribosomal protein S3